VGDAPAFSCERCDAEQNVTVGWVSSIPQPMALCCSCHRDFARVYSSRLIADWIRSRDLAARLGKGEASDEKLKAHGKAIGRLMRAMDEFLGEVTQ